MRAADLFATSRDVFADRGRAALTLLGTVIGVASIVLLAGLMRGGEEALLRTEQGVTDSDLIEVRRQDPPERSREKTARPLARPDADAVEGSLLLGGARAASASTRRAKAHYGAQQKRVSVASIGPSALDLYHLEIALGRPLAGDDFAARRRVCVVGHEIWKDLLGAPAALDHTYLTFDDERWEVVGALRAKPILGSTDSTEIWDRKILVAETTYDAVFSPSHEADQVFVRPARAGGLGAGHDATSLRKAVEGLLLRRHFGVANFKLEQERNTGQQQLILEIIKVLLLTAGLLALVSSGINIMNVMLVVVSERTREIGVRRAVGAKRAEILAQFLGEALLLSLAGGVAGVLSGITLSWLSAAALRAALGTWAFHLELWSVFLGLGLAGLTGIVFGIMPAWRASRLSPIEALRFE